MKPTFHVEEIHTELGRKKLSRFSGRNPEKFNFENLSNIPQKFLVTHSVTDTPPIEATAEGVA